MSSASTIDCLVNSGDIPPNMPTWIAMWIMDKFVTQLPSYFTKPDYCRCDELDPESGGEKVKDLSMPRATYAHAQKMRAVISHKFGCDLGLGMAPWTENPLQPGEFLGNPSLSPKVSQYMVSLQRRKVKAYKLTYTNGITAHMFFFETFNCCRSMLANKS